MTLEVEQAGRQGLTTQAPQSSESYRMSKEGSNLEAEVEFNYVWSIINSFLIKVRGIGARMEGLEKRQEEIVKLLNSLKLLKKVLQWEEKKQFCRSELAGISSGMARRDSLILGGNGIQQLQGFRLNHFYTILSPDKCFQKGFVWSFKKRFLDLGKRGIDEYNASVSCHGGGTLDTSPRGDFWLPHILYI